MDVDIYYGMSLTWLDCGVDVVVGGLKRDVWCFGVGRFWVRGPIMQEPEHLSTPSN